MLDRLTVDDRVAFRNDSRTGVIIEDDYSAMPYLVQLDDGGQVWCTTSQVRRFTVYTICYAQEPMSLDGSIKGRCLLVPNVDISKPLPNTGRMYGFAGLDNLKATLEHSLGNFLDYAVDPEKVAKYPFIYLLRGGDIVQMTNVEFGAQEEPFKPYERLDIGGVYRLTAPLETGERTFNAGTILLLEYQEPEDYDGKYPYLFEVCNHDTSFWCGIVQAEKL